MQITLLRLNEKKLQRLLRFIVRFIARQLNTHERVSGAANNLFKGA